MFLGTNNNFISVQTLILSHNAGAHQLHFARLLFELPGNQQRLQEVSQPGQETIRHTSQKISNGCVFIPVNYFHDVLIPPSLQLYTLCYSVADSITGRCMLWTVATFKRPPGGCMQDVCMMGSTTNHSCQTSRSVVFTFHWTVGLRINNEKLVAPDSPNCLFYP